MKSALFVDFDNVYSGLRRLDPSMADRFALHPDAWIRWLTDTLAPPPHAPAEARRRLLVRRCYLNPQVYQRFRLAFNRAGFEIIDCPPMTSEGKTSTDIHMVLDIVDLLQHEVHYDEFIVFSADADFTPVLRKLRRWDRRTTVLAVGFPSAAYQASADMLIDLDDFVRAGLGFGEPDEPPPRAVATKPRSDIPLALTAWIRKAVAESAKAVQLPRLAALAPKEIEGLEGSDWGGYNSFRLLVNALNLAPLVVNWEAGVVLDPSRHPLPERVGNGNGTPAATKPPQNGAGPGKHGKDPVNSVLDQARSATNMPLLTATEIRALLQALSLEVADKPFALSDTGKRVRDRCREAGHGISRSDVSYVLKGIAIAGHDFAEGQNDATTLGNKFIDSVLSLCAREQLPMDATAEQGLRAWASGTPHNS